MLCRKPKCEQLSRISVVKVVKGIRFDIKCCEEHEKWAIKYIEKHVEAND